jgi:hypothetical protein
MLASNTLAVVSHGYAYDTERDSAHIKRTALQRVYTASQQLQELSRPADPQQRLLYVPSPQPTLPATASAHRSASNTRRFPVRSQSPSCSKRRPSVRHPASQAHRYPASRPQPPGGRKEDHRPALRKHARRLARCNRGSRQTALFSVAYVVVTANTDIPHCILTVYNQCFCETESQ